MTGIVVGHLDPVCRFGQGGQFFRQALLDQKDEDVHGLVGQLFIVRTEIGVNLADTGVAGSAGRHHVIDGGAGQGSQILRGQLFHGFGGSGSYNFV